jgi:hypothetical protein
MTDIVIRNPVGRWMFFAVIGVVQLVLCGGIAAGVVSECPQPGTCTAGAARGVAEVAGPILAIFLLFAWVSASNSVTLSDDGVAVRPLLVRTAYPWSEIALVRKVQSGSAPVTVAFRFPEHKVQLVFRDGSEVDLPAPRAFGPIGGRGYGRRADTIWREWWRREAPRTPDLNPPKAPRQEATERSADTAEPDDRLDEGGPTSHDPSDSQTHR